MKKTFKYLFLICLVVVSAALATAFTYRYIAARNKNNLASSESPVFMQSKLSRPISYRGEKGYFDFTDVAAMTVNGVVNVKSVSLLESSQQFMGIDPFEFFFGSPRRGAQKPHYEKQVAVGSGVIISEDGYIITNNHVIQKSNDIQVTLNNGKHYKAKLIGTDPRTDLALLKIEEKNLNYIPFGNSDKLKVGEWILAIGNPFNLNSTVTSGIVSAKNRSSMVSGKNQIQSFIQVDAAINSGNSGGALVDMEGKLVGINTMIYSHTGDFAGIGFAIPISIVAKVASDLKQYGAVQRAVLGLIYMNVEQIKNIEIPENLEMLKDQDKRAYKFYQDILKYKKILSNVNKGIFVTGFANKSQAREAGIKEGDIINGINGAPLKNSGDLVVLMERLRPGEKADFNILRNGKEKTISVTLGKDESTAFQQPGGIESLGAVFKKADPKILKKLNLSSGVEITKLNDNGIIAKSGLKEGFIITEINNSSVEKPEDIRNIIADAVQRDNSALLIIGFYPDSSKRILTAIDLNNIK